MKVSIVSLKGKLFEGEGKSVNAKTQSGEITVLDHHRPLVTLLAKGEVVVTLPDGEQKTFPTTSGFLEMDMHNSVSVLLD